MHEKNDLISIAMTSYNGEKYIREQLDSILTQTYGNFELIICDDRSKDSTVEIIKDYCIKDSRIKLYVNEKNLGFKKNFEKAISLCKGEYIALSDQDDIWLPEHLEKLLNLIQGHLIACGNAELIDENNNSKGINLNETEGLHKFEDSDNLLYKLFCTRNPFQGASMLMHRSFFEKALPIPENIPFHDTWFAFCSCFSDRIRYTFDIITRYRQHTTQVTQHNKRSTLTLIRTCISRIFERKKYETDRFDYINELKKRYSVTAGQEKIIQDCIFYFNMRARKLPLAGRIKALKMIWNNYDHIFTTSRQKYRFFLMAVYFIF